MAAIRKAKKQDDDSVFDNFDAVVTCAESAFERAAKDAMAENDRLGIPTHSAANGKLVVRQPQKT